MIVQFASAIDSWRLCTLVRVDVAFPVEVGKQNEEQNNVHHEHDHQGLRVVARGVKHCWSVHDRN